MDIKIIGSKNGEAFEEVAEKIDFKAENFVKDLQEKLSTGRMGTILTKEYRVSDFRFILGSLTIDKTSTLRENQDYIFLETLFRLEEFPQLKKYGKVDRSKKYVEVTVNIKKEDIMMVALTPKPLT